MSIAVSFMGDPQHLLLVYWTKIQVSIETISAIFTYLGYLQIRNLRNIRHLRDNGQPVMPSTYLTCLQVGREQDHCTRHLSTIIDTHYQLPTHSEDP